MVIVINDPNPEVVLNILWSGTFTYEGGTSIFYFGPIVTINGVGYYDTTTLHVAGMGSSSYTENWYSGPFYATFQQKATIVDDFENRVVNQNSSAQAFLLDPVHVGFELIDPSTGRQVSGTLTADDGYVYTVNAVPEPSTGLLLLSWIGAVAGSRFLMAR